MRARSVTCSVVKWSCSLATAENRPCRRVPAGGCGLWAWFAFSAALLKFSGLPVPRPSTLALGTTPDDESALNSNKG